MPVPLRLRILQDGQPVATRELARDLIKIGRLSSAHVHLDDPKAARIHAAISVELGRLSLIDMGSTEGTLLNGRRIDRGPLQFGDEIRIGDTCILVEDGSRPEVPPEPVPDEGAADEAAPAPEAETPPAEQHGEPPEAGRERRLRLREAPFGSFVPRAPSARRPAPGEGRLGLQIRYLWGDTLLEVTQHPAPAPVWVGATRRCEQRLSAERLGAAEWALVDASEDHGFRLNVAAGMQGEIDRGGGPEPLGARGYELAEGDFAWVEFGGLRAELSFAPQPTPLARRAAESFDFRFLNLLLLLLFAAGVFAVSASTWSQADLVADDLSAARLEVVRVMLKDAEPPRKNPLLQRLAEQKELQPGEAGERHRGKEGKMGKQDAPDDPRNRSVPKALDLDAKELVKRSALLDVLSSAPGGGLATVLGGGGLGGDLKGSVGNLFGTRAADAHGFGGLGFKGLGPGGGGLGETVGIGGVGTKGRGGGLDTYGTRPVDLDPKKELSPDVRSEEPRVVGYDKELVRRVIRRNIAQIRFCYENELQTRPELAGRVVVLFVIGDDGLVTSARTTDGSTLRDPELGACICSRVRSWSFPAPKGGGQAVVTYPFIFKQSGE